MQKRKKKCREKGCEILTYGRYCFSHEKNKKIESAKRRKATKETEDLPRAIRGLKKRVKSTKKKALRKRKKSPYTIAKDNLWNTFSTYIRLRDSNKKGYCKCCSCDYTGYYKKSDVVENSGKIQAGHFIPQSAGLACFVEETNVHAQCSRCNVALNGNLTLYGFFIDEKYGEGYQRTLYELSKTHKKYTIAEFNELTLFYKNKIEDLKSQKKLDENKVIN